MKASKQIGARSLEVCERFLVRTVARFLLVHTVKNPTRHLVKGFDCHIVGGFRQRCDGHERVLLGDEEEQACYPPLGQVPCSVRWRFHFSEALSCFFQVHVGDGRRGPSSSAAPKCSDTQCEQQAASLHKQTRRPHRLLQRTDGSQMAVSRSIRTAPTTALGGLSPRQRLTQPVETSHVLVAVEMETPPRAFPTPLAKSSCSCFERFAPPQYPSPLKVSPRLPHMEARTASADSSLAPPVGDQSDEKWRQPPPRPDLTHRNLGVAPPSEPLF